MKFLILTVILSATLGLQARADEGELNEGLAANDQEADVQVAGRFRAYGFTPRDPSPSSPYNQCMEADMWVYKGATADCLKDLKNRK